MSRPERGGLSEREELSLVRETLTRVAEERDALQAQLTTERQGALAREQAIEEARSLLRQVSALLDAIAEQEPSRAPQTEIPVAKTAFFKAITRQIKKALPAEEPVALLPPAEGAR
jgi:hypothetical protein